MAKTFYGYAERDAESYVDWSQIGSDISEMLNEEISRRTTLKADLDKASREYGETLANAPTGEHKGATDFITDLTSNAMQARLVQDRLLKSGQLKVKDYLLMRENLKSGTQQVFDVAKKFQEEYARKTERMTKNESAAYEQELFKLTEGFSNFNNSGAYINPTNYQVSLAKKNRVEVGDGNYVYQMSKNPSEFFTVAELNNFASADVDRFDIAGAVSNIASQIGERVNQTYSMDPSKRSFIIQAVSDASGDVYRKMLREGDLTPADVDVVIKFQEQIKSEIQAVTANRFNALSVYTDAMSGFKGFTFNEDEQGDGMVLLDKDPAGGLPTPNFKNKKGEELLIDIEKNILNRIKVRLDQSVTATGTQIKEYTGTVDKTANRKRDRAKNMVAGSVFLSDLLYGNDKQKSEALDALKGYNRKNVIQYRFQKDARTGTVDLVVDVPSDKKQKKFETQVLVSDFNNNTTDVARVVRGLLFDDITNVLDQEAKGQYEASMADVILDNYNRYTYNGKPLTKRQIVPVQVVDEAKSDRTRSPIIPAAQRQVAEPGVGTVMSAPDLYREMKKSRDLSSGSDFATSISMAFTQTPAGERDDVVPLSNMKVEPLTADAIEKDYGIDKSYEAVRLSDPSLFTRPILIPAWNTMYESAEAAMIYLDKEAARIERGERTNKIEPSELEEFFTYTRTGPEMFDATKDDITWFKEYNPVPAGQGMSASKPSSATSSAAGSGSMTPPPAFPEYKEWKKTATDTLYTTYLAEKKNQ